MVPGEPAWGWGELRGCRNSAYVSLQNQLSGYLLRKFKNSDGWQKLWVVFTNLCLFFYKTHQVGAGLGLQVCVCVWCV